MQVTWDVRTRSNFAALSPGRVNSLLSKVLNKSIEEAQAAQRELVARRFIDRQGKNLLRNMIKIGRDDRPRPDRLVGRVRVVGPERAEDRRILLFKHEEGGVRRPGGGGSSIDPSMRVKGVFWLPTKAIRPQFSYAVAKEFMPAALHLKQSRYEGTTRKGKRAGYVGLHATSAGKLQLKGGKRTFVMFGANGGAPIGVFQRSGKSQWGRAGRSGGRALAWNKQSSSWHTRDDIRLIWAFRPSITLKPRLEFHNTTTRVLQERVPANFTTFAAAAFTP
jgi:hypothetical protein